VKLLQPEKPDAWTRPKIRVTFVPLGMSLPKIVVAVQSVLASGLTSGVGDDPGAALHAASVAANSPTSIADRSGKEITLIVLQALTKRRTPRPMMPKVDQRSMPASCTSDDA
jgi:hypothetical protein